MTEVEKRTNELIAAYRHCIRTERCLDQLDPRTHARFFVARMECDHAEFQLLAAIREDEKGWQP